MENRYTDEKEREAMTAFITWVQSASSAVYPLTEVYEVMTGFQCKSGYIHKGTLIKCYTKMGFLFYQDGTEIMPGRVIKIKSDHKERTIRMLKKYIDWTRKMQYPRITINNDYEGFRVD